MKAKREEEILEKRFGEKYSTYKQSVPRFMFANPLKASISFVLFAGRRLFCYWACPLGFLQDLTGKANLCQRNRKWGLVLLVILLIVIGLIAVLTHPTVFIKGAGAWLGLFLIIISIFVLTYLGRESRFRKLKYFILGCWAFLAVMRKVPGP